MRELLDIVIFDLPTRRPLGHSPLTCSNEGQRSQCTMEKRHLRTRPLLEPRSLLALAQKVGMRSKPRASNAVPPVHRSDFWGALNWLSDGFKLHSRKHDTHKKSSLKAIHDALLVRAGTAQEESLLPHHQRPVAHDLGVCGAQSSGTMTPHDVFHSW